MKDPSLPIKIKVKRRNACTKNPLERTLRERIKNFLNSIPDCMVTVRHQAGYGTKGDPDLVGCIRGRHIELEIKRPTNKPTPIQVKRMDAWKSVGAIVGCVCDIDQTRNLFKEYGVDL